MTTTAAAPQTATTTGAGSAPDAPMSHRQILQAMTGLLAGLFTALLSSTIVSVALPTIIGDLQGTQRQYTWVITAALLATTVTTPIWGKLADLFDKKVLVQAALVIFVLGSVGAGFAHNVPFLLGMRVVQGLGMGGLTALVQAILGSIIAPRERGRYSGYMGAVMAVSTVSGPLLGGLIVDSPLGWRWCFFVCIPLAVIALILLQFTLKIPHRPRKPKIDYLGAVLIAVGFSLPLLWVTFAGKDFDWISWQTGAYLGGSALLIVLAVIVELRVPEPLVPLRLLAHRTSVLVIIASIAVGVGMFGGTTFLGQYFQLARGYDPTTAGLMTIPLMVGLLISSTVSGRIISNTGKWKRFLVGGGVMLLLGLAGLGTVDHETPLWHLWVSMALMGIGIGAMMQNLVLAVQNTVDVKDIGATSATVAFFRSLGGAVGVSVLGAVLANGVATRIADGLQAQGLPTTGGAGVSSLDLTGLPAPVLAIVRAAYGDATGHIFAIGAAAAAVSLLCVIFVREVPLRTTVSAQPGAQAAEVPAQIAPVRMVEENPQTTDDHYDDTLPSLDLSRLDDPTERQAVAALDVLRAAQDQARQHIASSRASHAGVVDRIDGVGADVDAAVARFHAELQQIKSRLLTEESGASLNRDGSGGDNLRVYEYGLLRNAQETAENLTRLARLEAERVLTNADAEVSELEQRIARLRQVETDLSERVSDSLRRQDS